MKNNISPYRISGKERRILKRRLSKLKHHSKMFRYYEDINEVYGCSEMIEQEQERHLKEMQGEIDELEEKLREEVI
jgi:hypothetical protein